jgi:gamma-glutamylcysteine synthetase
MKWKWIENISASLSRYEIMMVYMESKRRGSEGGAKR